MPKALPFPWHLLTASAALVGCTALFAGWGLWGMVPVPVIALGLCGKLWRDWRLCEEDLRRFHAVRERIAQDHSRLDPRGFEATDVRDYMSDRELEPDRRIWAQQLCGEWRHPSRPPRFDVARASLGELEAYLDQVLLPLEDGQEERGRTG